MRLPMIESTEYLVTLNLDDPFDGGLDVVLDSLELRLAQQQAVTAPGSAAAR